jgi:hypothetical protein
MVVLSKIIKNQNLDRCTVCQCTKEKGHGLHSRFGDVRFELTCYWYCLKSEKLELEHISIDYRRDTHGVTFSKEEENPMRTREQTSFHAVCMCRLQPRRRPGCARGEIHRHRGVWAESVARRRRPARLGGDAWGATSIYGRRSRRRRVPNHLTSPPAGRFARMRCEVLLLIATPSVHKYKMF